MLYRLSFGLMSPFFSLPIGRFLIENDKVVCFSDSLL